MRRATGAVLLIAALACHEALVVLPLPVPVASLVVSPAADTLVAGDSVQLTATARDSLGAVIAGATITWTSDSLAFASVTSGGLVRTTFPGFAPVIAAAGTKSDTAAITIVPPQLLIPAAGGHHTCAPTTGAATYCWGRDGNGQLGGGFASLTPEPVPIAVAGTARYAIVAGGGRHTCALDGTGAAWCWGDNQASQLGRGGDLAQNPTPLAVTGGRTFRALTAGDVHSCGIATDSLSYCWGADDAGQLGDSAPGGGSATPRPVTGNRHFTSLSAGGTHTCGVDAQALYCWGDNSYGAVGDGTDSTRTYPVPVSDSAGALDVTSGSDHSCARGLSGAGFCWGRNDRGQLGTGQADSLARHPVIVAGGHTWLMLAAGGAHTCGIAADSLAYCWGANDKGQLGDSSFTDRPAPVAVHGGIHFTWITAGNAHTCGFSTAGTIYCWGDNDDGQLGDGTTTARPAPVLVVPR